MLVRRAEVGERQPTFPLDAHACLACGLIHVPDRLPQDFFRRHLRLVPTASHRTREEERELDALIHGLANGGWAAQIGQDEAPIGNVVHLATADPARLRELRDFRGPARVILLGECLERTSDLHALFEQVSDLLEPTGFVVTQTRWSCAALRNNAFDELSAEHLSLFSLHALAALGLFFGLVPVDAKWSDLHHGMLRVTFRRRGESAPSAAIAALMEEERQFGILRAETYDAFADRATALRDQLLHLLWELRAEGKRVAGYGMSEAGNTLLNFCGIGRAELDFIIDPDPQKDQLFSPGMKVPIRSLSEIGPVPPDVLLVVDDALVEGSRPLGRSRAQLLIPLPEPRLVS